MRSVAVSELSLEAFSPYGGFANMIDPTTAKIGAPPVEFFRDMLPLELGGAHCPSFSVCRVEQREMVIDVTECHSRTGEGMLPLDGDALIHVGSATPTGDSPPYDRFSIFRVPRGTFIAIRPGVWHHAPFSLDANPVNVLIVLPERTYANDCTVIEIPPEDRIRIETD